MNIISFKAFIARGGLWFLGSSIIFKFSSLLITILLAKSLDVELFGKLTQYIALASILVPLLSLSAHETYLYFGSEKNCKVGRRASMISSFAVQVLFGMILVLLTLGALSLQVNFNFGEVSLFVVYAALLSISNLLISYYRVIGVNKVYSILFTIQSVSLLVLISIFIYIGLDIIYAWPISSFVFLVWVFLQVFPKQAKARLLKVKSFNFDRSHLNYGLSITLGVFSSIAIFNIDTIMVGYLIDDKASAFYRVISIFPVVLLFIPSAYLGSDFKYLVSVSNDSKELIKYYKGYLQTFLPISIFAAVFVYLVTDFVVAFLLEGAPEYIHSAKLYFSVSILFTFLIRTPIGNLLNAKGLASVNVTISIIVLTLNIILNVVLIQLLGVEGAALASLLSFVLGSSISLAYFLHLVNKK